MLEHLDHELEIAFALCLHDGPWAIHIHSPHVEGGHKHVHLLRKGIPGKYSWNEDGTRHDAHSFPKNEKALSAAKTVAARHLGVEPGLLRCIAMEEQPHPVEIGIFQEPAEGQKLAVLHVWLHRPGSIGVFVSSEDDGRCVVVCLAGAA